MTIPATISTAITTLQTAITTAQASAPSGSLANASIAALHPVIVAAEAAYQAALTAQQATDASVLGINLDTITGASVMDGITTFTAEQTNIADDSDLVTTLGYLGRIVGNLTTAGG